MNTLYIICDVDADQHYIIDGTLHYHITLHYIITCQGTLSEIERQRTSHLQMQWIAIMGSVTSPVMWDAVVSIILMAEDYIISYHISGDIIRHRSLYL